MRQEVSLEPASTSLRDVIRSVGVREKEWLDRFVKDDFTMKGGSTIMVNGRNFLSLDQWETPIHEGDEITFVVPVAGG